MIAWLKKISQTGSGISQVFALLTDIIQTVLETSERFLSNSNNNMHVLASETEELAIYNGHLLSKLLNTAPAGNKATKDNPEGAAKLHSGDWSICH